MRPWEICPYETPGALRGRPLRYVLVHLLHRAQREGAGPMTVQELVAECESLGVVFDRRPSKLISDALRWEVRRGRVIKLERGVYAFGEAPRSTMWRIRKRTSQYIEGLRQLQADRLLSAVGVSAVGVSAVFGNRSLPESKGPPSLIQTMPLLR